MKDRVFKEKKYRFGAFAGDNQERNTGDIRGQITAEKSVFERHTEDQ